MMTMTFHCFDVDTDGRNATLEDQTATVPHIDISPKALERIAGELDFIGCSSLMDLRRPPEIVTRVEDPPF